MKVLPGWVKKQYEKSSPVLTFDISTQSSTDGPTLNKSLRQTLAREARNFNVTLYSDLLPNMLIELAEGIYKKLGRIVLLIDEYDKPILDYIITVKSCSNKNYFRFIMITGISKFSKTGVFFAMNDLLDISLMRKHSDLVRYTQEELEYNFVDWIEAAAKEMGISREELLSHLKEYYDGFSFDGKVRLYNPFSILNFFADGEFSNYWYDSGSPSFIVKWMEKHQIYDPEEYRHKVVKKNFTNSQEIERTDPSSFLFQSGYLTIEGKDKNLYTLDYPNREVLESLSSMYLELIYKIDGYSLLGNDLL